MAEDHVGPEAVLTVDLWISGNRDSTSCSEDSLQCIVGRQVVSNR